MVAEYLDFEKNKEIAAAVFFLQLVLTEKIGPEVDEFLIQLGVQRRKTLKESGKVFASGKPGVFLMTELSQRLHAFLQQSFVPIFSGVQILAEEHEVVHAETGKLETEVEKAGRLQSWSQRLHLTQVPVRIEPEELEYFMTPLSSHFEFLELGFHSMEQEYLIPIEDQL